MFPVKATVLTVLALMAFAGNSILNRYALGYETIDAASFSVIRLISGAVGLYVITLMRHSSRKKIQGSWAGSVALFLYMVSFSFAYIELETGVGALILFATVQLVMISHTVLRRNALNGLQWFGFIVAFGGFLIFILPGVQAPPALATALMIISGFSWAVYSILGMKVTNPLSETTGNFIRAVPIATAVLLFAWPTLVVSKLGVFLAVGSGLVASGFGYALWYSALQYITPVQAAMVQLMVPILAAIAGILWLGESLTLRLAMAGGIILCGIVINVLGKSSTHT